MSVAPSTALTSQDGLEAKLNRFDFSDQAISKKVDNPDYQIDAELLFEKLGVGVLVFNRPVGWRHKHTKIAVVFDQPDDINLLTAWSGQFKMDELERGIEAFSEIAFRLIELRSGGWHFESTTHSYERERLVGHSLYIVNPIDKTGAFCFSIKAGNDWGSRWFDCKRALKKLKQLDDSPATSVKLQHLHEIVAVKQAQMQNRAEEMLFRLVIARYRELDMTSSVEISNAAATLCQTGLSTAQAIEQAYQTWSTATAE